MGFWERLLTSSHVSPRFKTAVLDAWEIQHLQTKISNLQDQVAGFGIHILNLETTNTELREKIASLETRNQDLAQQLARAKEFLP